MLGIVSNNLRIPRIRQLRAIDPESQTIYNRIIADGGVSNLTRLNFFVKGLKAIYGDLANVPVCYDAHWIGYKLGSGTGATAGQAAAKLYSLTVAGDAIQSTAASQPLLLAHNGASSDNYYWNNGIGSSGNFVSTPSSAANSITGDIEFVVYIDYKNNATFQTITSKIIQVTGFCYGLFINASNQIYMSTGNGITDIPVNSTASLGATFTGWIKVSRVSSTGLVSFATSTNPPNTNISSISFTSFGTPAIGYIGALGNPNNTVQIGAYGTNQLFSFQGKIYRATISNSIGGAPVVDFNPATYNAATSQTQWTSSTGEIWTISTGTATTGYKGQIVTKNTTQSDGVNDTMQAASYSLTATGVSVYSTYRKFTTAVNPSGFSVLVETSANVNSNQGFLVDFNDGVTSYNAIRGDVGTTNASFSDTSVLLKLVTSVFDLSLASEEASFYAVNNSALTKAGSTNFNNTTMTTLGLNIMARSGGAGLSNMTFNGLIISSAADNATTRTATYNLIRSLNENAF